MLDYLNKKGVKYEEKNVSENADFMEQLQNISSQDKTPTLNIDGKIVADAGVEDVKDLFRIGPISQFKHCLISLAMWLPRFLSLFLLL
jgi:glutaredoxin